MVRPGQKQLLRRKESATLVNSYAGEAGRGIFQALGADFAMLVAVSHFGTTNIFLLWLLTSSSFVGYFFSLLSAPLSRYRQKKNLVLFFEFVARLLVLIAAAAQSAAAFVIPMALARAGANLATPLVNGIYGTNFCTSARGPAVARLQMVRLGTVALCGIAFTAILRSGGSRQFRWIALTAGLVTLGLSLFIRRLPETRRLRVTGEANSLRDCFRIMTGDHAFMLLELGWFLLGLANLVISPLRVLYLHDLGYADSTILLCTTTAQFTAMVLSVPLWGKWLYRLNFGVYRVLANVVIMAGILVFFRARHPAMVCLGSALWGAGLAGGGLCWRLVATFFTPPDRGPVYMSVHTFFCGLRGLVGPLIGLVGYGAAISAGLLSGISLGVIALSSVIILLLIPALGRRAARMAGG
jgi:MFS family permease